jgi:hypothetical protein
MVQSTFLITYFYSEHISTNNFCSERAVVNQGEVEKLRSRERHLIRKSGKQSLEEGSFVDTF